MQKRKLIETIKIDPSNLEYISKTGKINGTLLVEIERVMEEYKTMRLKPHCWGKMDWILKYPEGEEPSSSICNCSHGSSTCLKLTRENAKNL